MKLRCEPESLLLGFVPDLMLEENLRLAMILGCGDPTTFLTRSISAGLLVMTVIVLVAVLLPAIRKKRNEVFVESD
jgi:putative tricarboxylic transport membrane protein